MMSHSPHRLNRTAFTLPEVLVVMGVIAVLVAVLLPALTGGLTSASMANSQSRMRQIAMWMSMYSSDHREFILPSQFNYQDPSNPNAPVNNYPVKVRSHSSLDNSPWGSWRYKGTWADILWTTYDIGASQNLGPFADQYRYDTPEPDLYDSDPAGDIYEQLGIDNINPFRAAAPNSANSPGSMTGTAGPTPYGDGAKEAGMPGYFAANNFFNADPNAPDDPDGNPPPTIGRWYTTGQIKAPDRSMYLVDSLAGETIDPVFEAYDNTLPANPNTPKTIQVDFRYNGACLMMFLDGHSAPQTPWTTLTELEGCTDGSTVQLGRGIRIRNLTSLSPPRCP